MFQRLDATSCDSMMKDFAPFAVVTAWHQVRVCRCLAARHQGIVDSRDVCACVYWVCDLPWLHVCCTQLVTVDFVWFCQVSGSLGTWWYMTPKSVLFIDDIDVKQLVAAFVWGKGSHCSCACGFRGHPVGGGEHGSASKPLSQYWDNIVLTFSHKLGRVQPGAARSHLEQETLDKSNRATAKMTLDMTLGRLFCFVIYRAMPPKPKPMTMESVLCSDRRTYGVALALTWIDMHHSRTMYNVQYVLIWYVLFCDDMSCHVHSVFVSRLPSSEL